MIPPFLMIHKLEEGPMHRVFMTIILHFTSSVSLGDTNTSILWSQNLLHTSSLLRKTYISTCFPNQKKSEEKFCFLELFTVSCFRSSDTQGTRMTAKLLPGDLHQHQTTMDVNCEHLCCISLILCIY